MHQNRLTGLHFQHLEHLVVHRLFGKLNRMYPTHGQLKKVETGKQLTLDSNDVFFIQEEV